MSGELMPLGDRHVQRVDRNAVRSIRTIGSATQVEQATVRAKTRAAEFAVNEVGYLKAVQHEMETANPDAAEAIAVIVNATVRSIARSISDFNNGLD